MWFLRNMVSQKHGFLETWFLRNMVSQKHGFLQDRKLPVSQQILVQQMATQCTLLLYQLYSGVKPIQRMDLIRIATWRIFRENIFYIFEKLNYRCKVNIIFIKSFYLNGKTKFYEIILALLENCFILLRIFFLKIEL